MRRRTVRRRLLLTLATLVLSGLGSTSTAAVIGNAGAVAAQRVGRLFDRGLLLLLRAGALRPQERPVIAGRADKTRAGKGQWW